MTKMTQPVFLRQDQTPVPVPAVTLPGRVLLAEDVPSLQQLLRCMLKRMNVEVEIAADGRAACELAEHSFLSGRPYDLILMDIRMPERDGYEATRWLRQHGWQGPVVALTASAMDSDREKCLNAGCDAHIAKPVSLATLREILTRFRVPASHGVSPTEHVYRAAEPQAR